MAHSLVLPNRIAPSNLHLRDSVTTTFVDGDLYHIADRIKELSEDLYIVQLEEGGQYGYAIMEHCRDGVDRLVFRTPALDGRVVDKLKYLMSVPLKERFAIAER